MTFPGEWPRIGVDLGGTKIEAVLLGTDGSIVSRLRVPTPRGDYDGTLDAICELVERLEKETDVEASIGIGTPGAISAATGRIKNANSTWLNGKPLLEDLRQKMGRAVRMANDADCFTLSEAIDGAAQDARTVFGVILGTGVGGGIVVDRKLIGGPNSIAGEWGHNPLPWPETDELPGVECYCGCRGCIETFLSGPGLSRDHHRTAGQELEPSAIFSAAAAGEAAAEATLERYESRLARALATVINLLDPEVIVLGGGLSNLERLYGRVPKLWQPWVFSDRVDTRLVPPAHGDSSGVRGAAWLWEAR